MAKKRFMTNRGFVSMFMTATMLACCPVMGLSPMTAASATAAQSQSIRGVVVDENGESVIGASVTVVGKNASTGTITDFDGVFVLKVSPGTQLKITYVGYDDVIVEAKDGMKVTMKENSTMLAGVEVVAYGVQKKVTVTGALSSVKGEDLVRTPVSNVTQVLGGQMTGITTVQYSGEPGEDAATVYVRGQATFNGSEPLVQVDGVERSMSDIDPEEIESITVLKDASATAVFGVRGANGVILITTKRGKEGKISINGSTSWSVLTPTKIPETASSYDYALFHNQMMENDGAEKRFSDELIEKFRNPQSEYDRIRFPSTQWTDYIMRKATLQTKTNVNIAGGTDKVRYFINLGYYTQGGLFKEFSDDCQYGYQYNRFNYRSNLDIDLTKTTTMSVNIAGNIANNYKPRTGQSTSTMIAEALWATPFSSPGFVDDKLVKSSTDYTDINLPFVGSNGLTYWGNGFTKNTTNKLQMDLQLSQKLDFITKGLLFKIKGSYNSTYYGYKYGDKDYASYTPIVLDDGTLGYRKSDEDTKMTYSNGSSKARDWYFETSLNYNRSFGLHTIGGLLLYNQSKTYYPKLYSDIPRTYVGLVGRVTYDWNNRYMAEFNIGYNGSENFAEGKRFGTFPAGSVGWVVSEEPFWKPIKKVVSFLKLRASYGTVGNDIFSGQRFMYLDDQYGINSGSYYSRGGYAYNFGQENSTAWKGAYESAKNNPDVTWERAYKQDYGVDINFLDDRLRATFDYYKEHRENILLIDYTSPTIIGYTMPVTNLGEVDSWGWELSLNWQDKLGKDGRYWVNFNLSHNQNEIVEMKEAPLNNDYQYQKGHRIGSRSLYQFYGFYSKEIEEQYKKDFGVDKFPTQLQTLQDGDCVYVDLDGNGYIDENDMSRGLGYTNDPEFMAGLTAGFSWKNFTFNMQWTSAWNVSRLIENVYRQPFISRTGKDDGGLLVYHLDNTWTADNPSQDAKYPRATLVNANNNYASSTLYDQDAKYLRLKTLQIAYDFHFDWMKKLGMNQLQLALSGYNLLTFTPYIFGDPETRASSSPSYPLQRTYTATLKVGF